MNIEIIFQLLSLFIVVALGPIVIFLISTQKGNL